MGSREPVVVDLLGPFQVRVGERPVRLPPGRLRILLATLALSAGRAVTPERLTDVLWDDDELPDNARRTVQTYVTRLRQALGADAITNEPAGYVLRTAPERVDALRFERLVARSGDEPDIERLLLTEALQLWRGEVFEDLDSDRLRSAEGRRLAERWLTATERRIDLDLAEGKAGEVVAELHDLAVRHPLRETLWVRLLVALGQTGRQAEALEQYEVVRTRIADELGVDPGAELRRTFDDLLQGTAADDVDQAQRSTPTVPRQLPADIAGFRGRDRTLAILDDALVGKSQAVRVVAVDGIGGVGKTALALHWAHRRLDDFPDGQLYLNLRGYGPQEPVTAASALDLLLRGLGLDGQEIPVDADARGGLFRSLLADLRTLVILDNARDAEQVRPLLPGAGDSRVIVTSRSQLRGLVARDGARRIDIDRLEPDEAIELLAATLSSRRIDHTTPELLELAERCGHLPLALAIAAERASRDLTTGLAELIAELRDEGERLDALDAGEESIDLRAVFAWSYQDLEPDAARLFRLLGLHPGPDFGITAAVALTGLPGARVRRVVDRLVAANLLHRRRSARYELHDLVRAYAGELAARSGDPTDSAEALDRLFDWYLATAMNAAVAMSSGGGPFRDAAEIVPDIPALTFASRAESQTWFATERRVLLAVIFAAADQGRDRHVYLLSRALATYLQDARSFDDLAAILRVAVAPARRIGPVAEGHVETRLGRVAQGWSQLELAAEHYGRAIALFEQGDARSGLGSACNQLAMVLDHLGRVDEAQAQYRRAVAAHREQADHHRTGVALNNLAMSYLRTSRYDDAASTAQQVLDIARDVGDHRLTAYAHDTRGQAELARGDVDAAIGSLRRSRDLLHDLGLRYLQGVAALNLGRAQLQAGHPKAALTSLREAEDILEELQSPDSAQFSRSQIAELRAMADRSESA